LTLVALEAPMKAAGNDTPQRQKPSELKDDSVKISPLYVKYILKFD
jgi:hypothetical protein